jgi:serine/threonine-protein kinase RsbW
VAQESVPHSRRASAAEELPQDYVEVRLPADGAYLSVLRTATAGLAARLDFTLDEIEDLRIAVDEACAMLISQVVDGDKLACRFEVGHDSLLVEVSARTREGSLPSRETFAWRVLSALAGNVEATVNGDRRVHIRLHKKRDGTVA